MRIVKVGFSRPSKSYKSFPIFSWIIRLFEGTPYSHVYAEFYSESLDRRLIYEASGLKVKFVGGELFDKRVEKLFEYEVKVLNSDYRQALQFAVDNADKPYSILQVIGLGWVILGRRMGYTWSNPFRNADKEYVCSELIAALLPELSEEFSQYFDEVTPGQIQEYLERRRPE